MLMLKVRKGLGTENAPAFASHFDGFDGFTQFGRYLQALAEERVARFAAKRQRGDDKPTSRS